MKLLLPFVFTGVCLAFSSTPHTYLGNLLQNYLEKDYPQVYQEAKVYLSDFGDASTWADRIKGRREFQWSLQLHYIDVDACGQNSDIDLNLFCKNNCIYTAILNMTNSLKFNEYSKQENKFLLHFLQDAVQPMHYYGLYRGGNSWKVNVDGHWMSMHYLWDSLLPEYFIKNEDVTYNVHVNNFTNMIDYSNKLKRFMNKMVEVSCSVTEKIEKEIKFKDYYNSTLFQQLFSEYLSLTVSTFVFIFTRN